MIIVILLLEALPVLAQEHFLHYRLMKSNDSVGILTVIENRTPASLSIQTETKAVVPALLFNITIEDQKVVAIINCVLHSATVSRKYFNGMPDQSKTILAKGIYSDGRRPIPALYGIKAVHYCCAMLYTTEPLDKSTVYSEFHRQFVPIKKIAEHTYCIRLPDGQIGTYFYEQGICIRVVTQTTWATIEAILINQNLANK